VPVFLDVESRLDRRAVEATAREITTIFNRLGADVSKGLGGSLGKAFGAFDTTAARAELGRLEVAWRRAADVEADAARRMEISAARASAAVGKYGEDSVKAMGAQAVAARSQRDYADALYANEAAQRSHSKAMQDSAAAATIAGRAWNAAGVGSLAVFTGSVLEATKKAGDFQQSQQRLIASAGETSRGLKEVSDGILQMAGQVGYSSQELSKGMYTVEKAGYRGAEGVNVLRSAAQLAKAENADLGEVLNGLTTSMHDFGYSSDRSAEVASKMNTAVGMAKTNLQEFSGALHSVEPIAAAANIKLEDVYGSLAQITQSGTPADQGAQNMAHSISQLMKPSQQMREEMGQMGVDARDVQAHLGDRGFAGTVQMLSDTIRQHMNPAGQIVIDTMFKSQQATDSATQIFNNLPPAAKAVAESIQNGTLSYKDFRKTRGGLDVEQANELQQWVNLNNKVEGYSQALKSGQGDIQTYEQALALMTGGQDSLRTVLQLVGNNTKDTNDKIKAIKDTTADADGTVKGFNETQETLNAKMSDAKAAFGAAAIEIGSAFVPFMTEAANVAKDVGDWMGKHPAIMHAAVDALGVLGTAWLTFKGISIVETILSPITTALGAMAAEEGVAAVAAGGLKTALGLLGPAAAGVAIGLPIADATRHSSFFRDSEIGNTLGQNPVSRWINKHTPDWLGGDVVDKSTGDIIPTHAAGGPVHGRGPNGVDSVHAMLAPGEHVLTHHDVSAMGGHHGVYAFREALHGGLAIHRQNGGAIPGFGGGGGPDAPGPGGYTQDQAAQAIIGAAKARGLNTEQTLAALSVGILETNLGSNPMTNAAQNQSGTVVQGLMQQDSSYNKYGGRTNPNAAAAGYIDQFIARGGLNKDPYQGAVDVQKGTYGPGYVRGFRGQAEGYYDRLSGQTAGTYKAPAGLQNDPIYVAMTGGSGPGRSGGYSVNPQKVSAAEERLRHLDEEIRIAEERKNNMKADASQAEKDRLDEELRHLHSLRDQAQQSLSKVQQGSPGRGGSMAGNPFLPVPLAQNFGLSKGLGGVVEWGIGALEDMVLGPLETAAWAAMGQAFSGGEGMPPGPGDAGFGAPELPAGPSGGGGPGVGAPDFASGSPGSPATGASGFMGYHGWDPSKAVPNNFYKQWYPKQASTDLDGMPPAFVAWAQQHGMVGPDGNLDRSTVPLLPPPPGSLSNPKSVAAPVKMQPDMSRLWSSKHYATGGPIFSPGGDVTTPYHPGDDSNRGFPTNPSMVTDLPGLHWGPDGKPIIPTGYGPKGSDNVPAWLSPGEFVMNTKATSQFLPQLQAMNYMSRGGLVPQYFDDGSQGPVQAVQQTTQGQLPNVKDPGSQKSQGSQPGPLKAMMPGGQSGQQPGPPTPGAPPIPSALGPAGQATPGAQQGQAGNAAPTDAQHPEDSMPASSGIGFSGGVLGAAEGAAEGAASAAGNAFAPGAGSAASSAMSIGFQELNRAAAYGAQAGGILAEGALETIMPSDGSTNWMQTIPGRLLSGIAGARPENPNTAGQTKQPLGAGQSGGGYGDTAGNMPGGYTGAGPGYGGDIHINGPMTVQANDPQHWYDHLNSDQTLAEHSNPMSGNFKTGRN
jgi:hypothetical protein